jgi:ribosomal protein S10
MKTNKQSEFERNSFYERLIDIRRKDRKTFDSISTATHLTLAEYERQKREHDLLAESEKQ